MWTHLLLPRVQPNLPRFAQRRSPRAVSCPSCPSLSIDWKHVHFAVQPTLTADPFKRAASLPISLTTTSDHPHALKMLSTILAIALSTSFVSAHYELLYPPTRGFEAEIQTQVGSSRPFLHPPRLT